MDEQTGTDDSLFDASDVEAVANDSTEEQAENNDGSAVEVTNEQTDSQDEAIEEPAVTATTQTGDAVDEFIEKKGINASDPDALRKVAEMYRNSEKGFYNKSQEAAQLQRQLAQQRVPQIQPDQQALNEVRSMRIDMDTKEWKSKHNLPPED